MSCGRNWPVAAWKSANAPQPIRASAMSLNSEGPVMRVSKNPRSSFIGCQLPVSCVGSQRATRNAQLKKQLQRLQSQPREIRIQPLRQSRPVVMRHLRVEMMLEMIQVLDGEHDSTLPRNSWSASARSSPFASCGMIP